MFWCRAFAALLLLTVLLAYGGLLAGHWAQTEEWLRMLLPAETALLGISTGLTFGARR